MFWVGAGIIYIWGTLKLRAIDILLRGIYSLHHFISLY